VSQTDIAHSASKTVVPEMVFRLIYRSKSAIAADRLDEELGSILRAARHKNAERGITGALLLYDDWFAQTLEGDEGKVRALYAHIEKDNRHTSVQLREENVSAPRVFSRWAMALVGEHGNPDIPLVATASGTAEAGARHTNAEQERILDIMRDATRGYGRGS
jgi:Sensors of blue-light using FAD